MQSMEEAKSKQSSLGKKLGIGCLGLFGALFVISAIGVALESPEDRAAREAKVEAEEKALAEAEKKASSEAAIVWHAKILEIAKACDASSKQLQEQFANFGNGSSMFTIYEAASTAKGVCDNAWDAYRELDVPSSFPSEAEDLAEEAHESCGNAYFAKRQFAELAMEVAEGDIRPSKVQEAKQYGETGSAGVLACVAGSILAAEKAGADIDSLMTEE